MFSSQILHPLLLSNNRFSLANILSHHHHRPSSFDDIWKPLLRWSIRCLLLLKVV